MKTGRAGRILCAGLLVLGGTAAVLWACSDTGGIHGTVTESLHGHVLCGSFMGLARTADPSYVASTNTDVNGDYKFTGLTPDGYTVSAGHMAYQPKTANVTVTAGGDVGKDFVLDPVAANIKADVVSLDQSSGGKTGGWRSVQVKITYQMMCHGPMRLVVWAWGGSPAKPYVIHDSSGTGGYDYSCWLDSTVTPNPASSGYDTVATLRFPWNTTWVPNGSYTIKAALKCSDPHKDGVDENPDPVAESWVHWAGSPPTATADGTAGGTTLSIGVTNLVITGYRAKDTPLPSHDQDAFLYDPDAASPLCNPSFEVSIDNWATEPMVIRVWMAATAWSDTRPVPDYDPYVDLDVNAAGTYTLTWDGSNPGYPYWEGEWGTWSFDVDVYRLDPSGTWAIDHFYAKSHDGWSENYDVLVDPVNHHVWWHCDETTTPPGYQFRCNYIVHSDESTQPTAVDLVTLKELTVKATQTGPVTLNTLHDNITTFPGSGYTTENDTLGTWRTVFTGQTASGAEHRRDGTNPRILATNRTKTKIDVDFLRLWDSHQEANRSTRAIDATERAAYQYEDNARSDSDASDSHPMLVLGGWGSTMASADVKVKCQFSPASKGAHVLWRIAASTGAVSGATAGDFSASDTIPLCLVPSADTLADHNGTDFVLRVGLDENEDGVLSDSEAYPLQWGVRVIGSPEYSRCGFFLNQYVINVARVLWPCAGENLDIFMGTNTSPSYQQDLADTVSFTGGYDQRNGLGCDPTSLIQGSLRKYVWQPMTPFEDKIIRGTTMWEDVIVPTITSMGVGAWYADPANATANAHTFSAPYSHTVAFNSDDDIVYALGQAGVNVSITVGTVRDTPKPRITFVHVSGQIADLYDFKTDGSDNHLGWAGRVQTCYAPSCSRTAGKVFNLLVNTSVSASTIDERPQHDAWGELRPLWIAAVANRP